MKTPALLLLAIMATAFVTNAQTTRIHLLRTTRSANVGSTKLYPVQLAGKSLDIPFRQHVVIETTSDSIGFIVDKKIGYIKFEKGRDYYFRIRYQFDYPINAFTKGDGVVDEVSEQNFKLSLLFNEAALPPQVVFKVKD